MNSNAKFENIIVKEINKLRDDLKQLILVNTTLVQEIANQISTKIDILCNLENSTTNAKTTQVKKSKILTKPMFLKTELKNDINKYLDVLYSQADLDELNNNSDVKSKKTELQKKNKIIDLLYIQITKHDSSKNEKLKTIYEEYKKKMEVIAEEIESANSENLVSEETKLDE